ncbi:MAG TPA: beta-ketoacyl synthase N-terminal-like domain-containing protein [Herpetosiphonaceae bacterium]
MDTVEPDILEGVAIIGMAGRFPGARTIEAFWHNLCAGIESITLLHPEEDLALQRDPSLRDNPNYVPAGGFLDDIDQFDAAFFGYSVREARIMDPQQRLFLECAWEALERAGYDSHQYPGRIGVYAGTGMNSYLLDHVYPNRQLLRAVGSFQTMLNSEKDFLATRVSYKLNLRGPSITVQTACSTSLVAVSLASQSLQSYQCDIALAGGVSLLALEKEGYLYEQGGIAAPDGHCRAFDADAKGTVGGSGLGVVVLKRLEDAVADGDQIYAVIKGSAMNNDGDAKMGYTAPSVEGQAEVITEALAIAGFGPETVGYIETHGTGTFIGDPIEVAALTQAFRVQTEQQGFCAIGSVKTNIGHLDAAAGVTGLIKAALTLKHQAIPPSLNFNRPNPQIDFASSPFYVNSAWQAWPAGDTPRRAGVSSFGIGGTNVHVALEEPPIQAQASVSDGPELLVLSAKTASALETMTTNLVEHLKQQPDLRLADVAYTLQTGRRAFTYRRMLVCASREDAITDLETRSPRTVFSAVSEQSDRPLIFLFPGQGAQHVNMGRQLYEAEPLYRECIDHCCDSLMPLLGLDLRGLLFPQAGREAAATEQLNQTAIAQVALFVTEYAVARLLQACGTQPHAMIGHSLGEYVAACIAGVMSLEDALLLVAERGRLMQDMPKGSMLSIGVSAEDARPLLNDQLSLAVAYGPSLCVVGGPDAAIEALAAKLGAEGIDHRRLHTSHAFHSWMMEPMLESFRQVAQSITLHRPQIPYISCTTGTWITDEQATSPDYWAQHVRQAVQLADGVQTLLAQPDQMVLEVGPAQMLKALFKQISPEAAQSVISIPTMRHPLDTQPDTTVFLNALGKLWLLGSAINLAGLRAGQRRAKVVLPTYPFERRRYWIEATRDQAQAQSPSLDLDDAGSADEQHSDLALLRSAMIGEYVQPRTETERKVAAIWQQYLGAEAIGVHDNFFELGGDSLLTIGLMATLRETFQVELSEVMLYEQPTVAALSEAIEHSQPLQTRIVPVSRAEPPLASWHQERRWIRDQRHPDQVHNNNLSIGWELHGRLDPTLFERSVNEVVKRHEAMRTAFAEINGEVRQIIAPTLHVSVPLVDLTQLPEAERDAEMLRLAAEEERSPLDMQVAPLWRMTLYRMASDRFAWIIVAHQSIWDGVSAHTVQREVGVVLEGLLNNQPWQLPELPVQFADFVDWERRRYEGGRLEQELAYWGEKLAGQLEPLQLPTDRPRIREFMPSAVIEWYLPKSLGDQLKALGREHGATLYMTLVAAFKALSYGYTRQEDILIESSFANRDRSDIETLVAPLVNMVTLRTNLSGNPCFHELLRRVRDTVTGAMAHRELPFVKVLEAFHPQYYAEHDRLGRVFIAQYEAGGANPPLPGLTYHRRLWFRRSMPDIYMSIVEYDESIEIAWEYNTHLFDEETIKHMFANYTRLLKQVLVQPQIALMDLTVDSEGM